MNRVRRSAVAAIVATPLVIAPIAAPAAFAVDQRWGPGQGWYADPWGDSSAAPDHETQPWIQDGSAGVAGQSTTAATGQETAGVVLVTTVLANGYAAGTGMVLTEDGTVVTNNHVIEGATRITVTDPGTGEQYEADLVAADAESDIAVLQVQGADGLATVTVDADDDLAVGDDITSIGNAEGEGVLVAATGAVTDLGVAITVSGENGVADEALTDLIEMDADIVSGDSGGAVLDADGEVVGMNVAASSGTFDVTGYAIPIDSVIAFADTAAA